uniref:Uncharacterized protein n=1 Tax=Anguilla anguilla TaxID=7936 RepID=A0A0E9TQT3_ANGAN
MHMHTYKYMHFSLSLFITHKMYLYIQKWSLCSSTNHTDSNHCHCVLQICWPYCHIVVLH